MKYLTLFEKFYNPSKNIQKKLDDIVFGLLQKYNGGREFFKALDNAIKDFSNKDLIISLLKGNENEWICSSGGFGDKLHNLYENGDIKCKGLLIFNGKMYTKDKGITSYYPENFDMSNKKFIFIDDSLFTGKTYLKIDEFLSEFNSKIKEVLVVYDGSKSYNPIIKSLFKYYDK